MGLAWGVIALPLLMIGCVVAIVVVLGSGWDLGAVLGKIVAVVALAAAVWFLAWWWLLMWRDLTT